MMLRTVLTLELRSHFPEVAIEFGGADRIIATIPPVHQSWKPIVIYDDEDEITVFFGDFTHMHFGSYGEQTTQAIAAQSIANDVINFMRPVFEDRLEFFRWWGGGGCRAKGSQGWLSRSLFGENGVVWSGS